MNRVQSIVAQGQATLFATNTVLIILVVAFVIRFGVTVARPTGPLDEIDNDAGVYVHLAQLATDGHPFMAENNYAGSGETLYITYVPGPLYPAFLTMFFAIFSEHTVTLVVQLAQTLISVATVWLAYQIGNHLFGRNAGLIAMAGMALDVRFAFAASTLLTETVYIALLLAAFYLYLAASRSGRLLGFVWSGATFGLAALTRSVPLLLPLVFVLHALLSQDRRSYLLKGIFVMALTLWAVVTPWLVRNAIVTDGQFIPVSSQGPLSFWLGSWGDGDWPGITSLLEARADQAGVPFETPVDIAIELEKGPYIGPEYVRAGLTNITSDPLGYVRLRAQAITRAYLQPFGTTFIGGPSLKDTAVLVLRGKASLAELVRTEGFWPKLTLYIFHYVSVGLGIVGLALSYRRWREILSLALILLYVTAVQSVLHVRARMLFPLMPFFWIAAGYAILRLWTHSDLSRPQKQVAAET